MTPPIRLVHRTSGAVLVAFVAIHLANHLVGLAGIEAHRSFMATARQVYRAPLVESLLLTAVMVQIVTGAIRLRAGWGERPDAWSRLQAWSGGYLLFYLANHTLSVLIARGDVESDFFLAAAVLTVQPLPAFFIPYYALGILALFAHLACAAHYHAKADRFAKGLLAAGVVVALLAVGVFAGAFYDIELPPAYRELVARYSPWS